MKLLWPESEPQAKGTGHPTAFAVGNTDKSSDADPNAITQSGPSVAPATPEVKATLSEKEKAAKAKMLNAAAKIAAMMRLETRPPLLPKHLIPA